MPFNPFTWNNSQPSASQNISSGQATILNDIQFLGSTSGVAQAGFIQLPNGWIIQWGITPQINGSGSNPTTINFTACTDSTGIIFMQAFPTACFGVWLQPRTNNISNKGFLMIDPSSPDATYGISKTQFKVWQSGTSAYSNGAYILAIGN